MSTFPCTCWINCSSTYTWVHVPGMGLCPTHCILSERLCLTHSPHNFRKLNIHHWPPINKVPTCHRTWTPSCQRWDWIRALWIIPPHHKPCACYGGLHTCTFIWVACFQLCPEFRLITKFVAYQFTHHGECQSQPFVVKRCDFTGAHILIKHGPPFRVAYHIGWGPQYPNKTLRRACCAAHSAGGHRRRQ